MSSKLSKITSLVVSLTTIVWLSGFTAFIPVANAQSIQDLLDQIARLQDQLRALQSGSGSVTSCNFTRSLTVGSRGEDVKCLQQYLNANGFTIASSGSGSSGNETTYFGSLTRSAVARWQAANGISPAAGYFGPISRAKALAGGPGPTPTPTASPVPGGSVSVSLASSQPAPGLFPLKAVSVPFTKVVFRASSDGDATIDALTVQRTGSANNAAFDGIIALDEDGVRLGTSKTLGSDNRVILTEDFVVKAGQSRTITIAGDAAGSLDTYAGQVGSLSLVGATTKGNTAVNATFPMVGTSHTVNSTLVIGTATLTRGPLDPGSGVTKEVGSTGYTFSSLRVTAGSAEKIKLTAVRWNQSGSASDSDIKNVIIKIDDKEFPATVSSDGKYYSSSFGGGIEIDKGLSKEILIKANIESGSSRTIDFDLFREADLQVHGLSFDYDIKPTAATTTADNDDDGEFQNAEPFYDAFQVTIGAETIQVNASAGVIAQNIGISLPDQPLGGFDVTVKGGSVSVGKMVFRINRASGSGGTSNTSDITNISLVGPNNTVVAGPVDVSANSNRTDGTITFTDTVVFPVGTNIYTLKGKVGTDFANNDKILASTTPSSDWTTVKGLTTNTTVSPTPSVAQTSLTMTVKSGDLRVSTAPTPASQTIVAGLKKFNFANFTFNTTASGEDIRINSVQVEYNFGQANSNDDLANCQIFDGVTALNTGSNVVNGANTDTTGDDKTFTFDQSMLLPKGGIKSLALKCDTTSTTTTVASTYNWTLEIPGDADDMVPTGVTSGSTLIETYDDTTGQAITLTSGGALAIRKGDLTVSATSSPILMLANTTGNLINDFIFGATNEDVRLEQMILNLDDSYAASTSMVTTYGSSTPQDLAKVTLWDGTNKVGETLFTGDGATTTISGFIIPGDGEKTMLVKADFARIGTSDPARPGHQVRVEYDGFANDDGTASSTYGTGISSGVQIYTDQVGGTARTINDESEAANVEAKTGFGSRTVSGGARIYKSFPTIQTVALTTNERKLANGVNTLYKFKVTAPSQGSVGLYKVTFAISTSTYFIATSSRMTLSNLQLYGYGTDFGTGAVYSSDGRLNFNNSDNLSGFITGGSYDYGTNQGSADCNGTTCTYAKGTILAGFYFNPVNQGTNLNSTTSREVINVPAGATRYFVLKGTASNVGTSSSALIELMGDAKFSRGISNVGTSTGDVWVGTGAGNYAFATSAVNVDLGAADDKPALLHNDFVWSGNSTTTAQANHYDFANGYLLPGLSNASATQEILTP